MLYFGLAEPVWRLAAFAAAFAALAALELFIRGWRGRS